MSDATLVVGLGNPGRRYLGNRHNFGFMVLDELGNELGAGNWANGFKGLHCRGALDGRRIELLKPATFMNLCGASVAAAASYYRIAVGDIIVVHDDLDLPFGSMRVKQGGGTGGHKGLNSIVGQLGDSDFVRVRMGIGHPTNSEDSLEIEVSDYVLSDFSPEEKSALKDIVAGGADAISHVVRHGPASAMNLFNRRGPGASAV